jgi:hypothetical protein
VGVVSPDVYSIGSKGVKASSFSEKLRERDGREREGDVGRGMVEGGERGMVEGEREGDVGGGRW